MPHEQISKDSKVSALRVVETHDVIYLFLSLPNMLINSNQTILNAHECKNTGENGRMTLSIKNFNKLNNHIQEWNWLREIIITSFEVDSKVKW